MTDINRLKVLAERAEALYGAPSLEHVFAITKFLEAVEPKAILGLIAEIERLNALLNAYKDTQKRYEWLAEDLKECASALPGTYYMDPPDGGNVSIPEQIRRMAKDAARYRWLRDSCTRQWDVMYQDIEIVLDGTGVDECEDLDGIIDAAIEGAKQ
ncbi:hypothetical protein RWC52_000287 [Pseudomonas aeruginosa]|nr:hypothetical protein [Pseudomonas aeruginosa]